MMITSKTNCSVSALPDWPGTRLAVSMFCRKVRNSLVRLAVSRVELSRRGGGEADFCLDIFLLGLPA